MRERVWTGYRKFGSIVRSAIKCAERGGRARGVAVGMRMVLAEAAQKSKRVREVKRSVVVEVIGNEEVVDRSCAVVDIL